ncbi:hypothetical protein AB0C61_14570 [Streptomyces sp. NPDC048680]|uniref:hypothetical protein n=1 Tax=Streptomyces sp. NPDC048680 TaxID=3155492 RepID=UPI0034319E9C
MTATAVTGILAAAGLLAAAFWGLREGAGILLVAAIWAAVAWRARQRMKSRPPAAE